jgi:hypothetical protein
LLTVAHGAEPTVPCCDLCDSSLLNQTRPAPPTRTTRKKNAASGAVDKSLKRAIVEFRKEIWTRDFADSLFGPAAILSDTAVESLSSFGAIDRLIDLENALGGYWAWFDRYGDELLELFRTLDIAPKQPKAPKTRAPRALKRAVETAPGEAGDGSSGSAGASKRTVEVALDEAEDGSCERREGRKRHRRSDIAGTPPTPVISTRPGPSTSLPLSTPSTPFRPLVPQMYQYAQPTPANYLWKAGLVCSVSVDLT